MTYEEQEKLNEELFVALKTENSVEKVKRVLEKGADVNERDICGLTALMCAQTAEQTKLLIEAGADVNAKDESGKIAWDYARNAEARAVLLKEMERVKKRTSVREHIEERKSQVLKSRQMRKKLKAERPEEKVSGVALADEIAKDKISGKEKRTITPEVGVVIKRKKAAEK